MFKKPCLREPAFTKAVVVWERTNVTNVYFQNAIYLLGASRSELPRIFVLFILLSIIDLIGIGIIGPFLSLVFSGVNNLPAPLLSVLSFAGDGQTDLIAVMAAGIVIIYAIKSIFGAMIMRSVICFSQNQQVSLRSKLITSYQNMAYSKIIQRNSSTYINTIQLMVPNYANLVMFCLQTAGDSVVAIVIIAFLAWTNPYALIFLVVVAGVCLIGFDLFVRNRLTITGKQSNKSAASIVRHTNETLRGFKEIRVLKQEAYFKNSLVKDATIFACAQTTINFFSMLPKYIFEMIIIIFLAGVSVLASYMVADPVSLIPTLGVFGMASIRIIPLARNFSFTLNRIRYSKDTVMKLADDLRDAENVEKTPSTNASSPLKVGTVDKISLDKIFYTYPNSGEPSLNGTSFEINAGEHIGIIGASGAGKTTLVDTLLGLLPPSSGQIMVNGQDITHHPEVLWQHVAYLPQEIFIIDSSIRENIALGVPENDIDQAQMNLAITRAQMENVIKNLPDGLGTNIGENGVRLSGGQRQRIALARAFYFNRSILVMDEATSSLDTKTELHIINYLKNLKNKITVISITHRAKSLEHCDRVLNIEHGQITNL